MEVEKMMEKGMRPSFIRNDDGEIIGVNLSSDFCAEHEWGIKEIKTALGIPLDNTIKENFGVKGRTITIFEKDMFFFEQKTDYSCLTFEREFSEKSAWENKRLESRSKEISTASKEISTAWNECEFGIAVSKKHQEFLIELYEVFKKKDVAIWLGRYMSGLIGNAGLLILIASKIPEHGREMMYKQDESRCRLKKAAEKILEESNIRQVLADAGKRGSIGTSRWGDETEKEIFFWTRPSDEENNNFGWFTLQDLKDWADNKGPIPKPKKKVIKQETLT